MAALVLVPSASASSLPEVRGILAELLRTAGRPLDVTVSVDSRRAHGIAAVRHSGAGAHVVVDPGALRRFDANAWAFILGHELGHVLGRLPGNTPRGEMAADEWGARLALRAGYDLGAYVRAMLREPESWSPTHGSYHRRAQVLARMVGAAEPAGRAPQPEAGVRRTSPAAAAAHLRELPWAGGSPPANPRPAARPPTRPRVERPRSDVRPVAHLREIPWSGR